MRYTLRITAFATITALAATVLLLSSDASQVASAAQPAEMSADLALVPADAVGFIHVRFADLWKNEVMDGFRKTWEKAGPKALETLDKQFIPAPSTISRASMFVLLDDKKQPQMVGVLAFSKSFDTTTVAKMYLPKMLTEKVNGKTVYRSPDVDVEFYFPDDKHIVIGHGKSLDHYLAKAPAKDGPLASAIKLAATGKKVLVASADISSLPIPDNALEEVPADTRAILKAKQLTIAVDLGADARFDVRSIYPDVAAAQDAEKAVKAMADLGRQKLAKMKEELEAKIHDPNIKTPRPVQELPEAIGNVFALGALTRLDETLADPKLIVRDKAELAVAVPLPKEVLVVVGGLAGTIVGVLVPSVAKVRGAASRMQSANNLKQIALAIHTYHDSNDHLPRDIVDKNGKPLLSWRVAILPYLEQAALYEKFKLDEPWDSENNKKWSQTMVKVFVSPDATLPAKSEWGLTSYRGISGPGTAFEAGKKLRFADFTDGLSNTIIAIETDELVPWAKPGDYPFDADKALPKITPPGKRDVFQALMGDGAVRAIKTTTPEKTLKAAFTRNGGEAVDLDKDK